MDPASRPTLRPDPDQHDGIAALTDRYGRRAGLGAVLGDLNRQAERTTVPGRSVDWGFRWNDSDQASERWWPRGITSSGEATDDGRVGGRQLLVAGWSSRQVDGEDHGSRLSVVDAESLAYRHVLLAVAGESFGEPVLKPLVVRAGGLAWFGEWLYVAGTRRGLFGCRLDDIIEVQPGPDSFGHRYVLPVRRAYVSHPPQGVEKLRYSFCSVARGTAWGPAQLLAGEYGLDGETCRLVRFALDPTTGELRGAPGGHQPEDLDDRGICQTQGAAVVDGTWYLTTEHGRRRAGQLHVGEPGAFRSARKAMPPGPQDLTYDATTDRLWSLSEYPGRRFVFCMERPEH